MAILGIDYGTRRIGLAHSDGLGMFAHGIGYLENSDAAKVISQIKSKCAEYQIEQVVVGLPRQLDGNLGQAAQQVMVFIDALKEELSVPVVTWDERMTTKGAQFFLRESGLSGKNKRKKIDQLAAQILLQDFLDNQRARRE